MKVGARAMILAAGKGTRMGRLSDTTPKPLTPVTGTTLIDRLLSHLCKAGVEQTVVNVHHLADQMELHLSSAIDAGSVVISDERDALLETGGGVKNALPQLGPAPFFVVNGDALWVDGSATNLSRMRQVWDDSKMDALLLLVKRDEALGYEGVGDFFTAMEAGAGPIEFRGSADSAPYVFGGVLLINPALYEDTPDGAWSNRLVFRKAAEQGRLYGLPIDGHWMHVGTPEAIEVAEAKLHELEAE